MKQLSKMGAVAVVALFVFEALRVWDLSRRGELSQVLSGPHSTLFLVEVVFGGVVPLVLLSVRSLREKPAVLAIGALLLAGGVVLNRLAVCWLAMSLRGAMPQLTPQHYAPTFVEWSVTLGLVAAAILLFGLGVRYLPVLEEREHEGTT
jgi:formate dehydrogenase iron-sulfur subunit